MVHTTTWSDDRFMRALADEVIGAKHVTISGAAHICNVGNPIEYNPCASWIPEVSTVVR